MNMVKITHRECTMLQHTLKNLKYYDFVYIVNNDKLNGEYIKIDDKTLYFINPEDNIRIEIVFDLLKQDFNNGIIDKAAIVYAHLLPIKYIKTIERLPIDFYAIKNTKNNKLVSASSQYLYTLNEKHKKV